MSLPVAVPLQFHARKAQFKGLTTSLGCTTTRELIRLHKYDGSVQESHQEILVALLSFSSYKIRSHKLSAGVFTGLLGRGGSLEQSLQPRFTAPTKEEAAPSPLAQGGQRI